MLLYLVRHGKAVPGNGDDAARTLTDQGRKAVGRVAHRLEKADVRVGAVEHSGLVRAEETARILGEALRAPVRAVGGLAPEDDVEAAAQRLTSGGEDVMIVGHMPFMGNLASYLLTSDPGACSIHFSTATVACFEGGGETWSLQWLLPPDLA